MAGYFMRRCDTESTADSGNDNKKVGNEPRIKKKNINGNTAENTQHEQQKCMDVGNC